MLHNALDVDGYDLQRAVWLAAVHHGSHGEGVLRHAAGPFEQLAHGADVAAHLIHAGAENGAAHFHHVAEAGEHRVDAERVAVFQLEGASLKFVEAVNGVFAAFLADEAHGALVGVAREAACIFYEGAHALGALHFVEHGAFHLAGDVDQGRVGAHHDDVARSQADVAREFSV